MKLNIALMITPPLHDLVMEILPELNNYCRVTVLTARSTEDAYALYMENWQTQDVFIFTGKILMLPAMKRVPEEAKRPYYGFDDMTGDIQDMILKLVLEDRNFDFSRTFIDVAAKENNYHGLRELLPPDQWPYCLDETFPDTTILISERGVDQLIEAVLHRHIELHEEGLIDLSITRFGLIVEELAARGLPYVYILPTREYIINFFIQVINSMNPRRTEEPLISVISLSFPGVTGRARNELMAQSAELVMKLATAHGLDFTLALERDTLAIITHHGDLTRLSRDFTDDGFRDHLVPAGIRVHIGLGSGPSIFQAKRNSFNALEISRHNSEKIYHVTEDNLVVGPLGPGRADPAFTRTPDEDTLHIAENLKLDPVILQKIMAFAKLGNAGSITADELADYLGVTVRTANRILTRILAAGGARVYQENLSGGRGRPKKYYELTFLS